MHSPKDAASASAQPSRRANHFSFPPTQRFGLLRSTKRSPDQRTNLQQSLRRLLEMAGGR